MTLSRRNFVKKSIAVVGMASTFALSGTRSSGQVRGANERLRVAVVGVKGRGRSHLKEFGGMENVEIASVVDVDETVLGATSQWVEKELKQKANYVQDIRKALEDKDLDVVSIATCNHTHSLFTIWSVQAGKDVYVEKPCSHNVFEGRKCAEAADKYKRIVQHGTQSRSSKNRALMMAAVKSGKYGKLKIAKGYCCKPRWTIGFKPVEEPPKTLDWDLWLGPAPMQPFHRNLVHYNWHWFWDTGNGDAGNQGVHEYDLCRWATGKTLPNKVISFGARYVNEPEHKFKDQGETPNQLLSLFDFGDVQILFETRGLVKNNTPWPPRVDVELYTDEGVIQGTTFTPYDKSKQPVAIEAEFEKPVGGHFQNFIECVRSRNRQGLTADILEGHYSSALFHLGNISYRLGKNDSVDSIKKAFGSDPVVQKAVDDVLQNTVGALPELKNPQYTLGPNLEFLPEKEKFAGNAEADKMLTRNYRAPYVVPSEV